MTDGTEVKVEDDAAAEDVAAPEEPVATAAATEDGGGGDNDNNKRPSDEAVEEEPAPKRQKQPKSPLQLGYCTFKDGNEAFAYFRHIISIHPGGPLNEYEYKAVADLLRKGHADPKSKIGSGVVSFTCEDTTRDDKTSRCFFLQRADGSSDDFSYRKCLVNLGYQIPKDMRSHGGHGGRGFRGGRGRRGGRRGGGGRNKR